MCRAVYLVVVVAEVVVGTIKILRGARWTRGLLRSSMGLPGALAMLCLLLGVVVSAPLVVVWAREEVKSTSVRAMH